MLRPSSFPLIACLTVAMGATISGGAYGGTTPSPIRVHREAVPAMDAVPMDGSATNDCGGASATPVTDGDPIVVQLAPAPAFTVGQIDPAVWRAPMVSDPSWRLDFEAFEYLKPLAARAAQDASMQSLATMVAQVAAFHIQNPDPGTATVGWDEGTAQRRLETENCLYSVTHDASLVAGMTADAAVQFGNRYYGPPNYAVHNHGLMANLQLVRAGELLGNETWISRAEQRMTAEAPLAFSKQGTTWEQSSTYQDVNALLWQQAADKLAANPAYATTVAAIRSVVARAMAVYSWMTEPDGRIVQIGDADGNAGSKDKRVAGVFRDDQAGLAIGRFSTAPTSAYYTLRYGPPRRAHGHQDRGGVTWSTDGMRVLVGVGRYSYDSSIAFTPWQSTPQAANVAAPGTGALRTTAGVRVAASTIQSRAQAWKLIDDLYPRSHTRTVNVNTVTHALRVDDAYSGTGLFRQSWHLDQAWTLVSADAAHHQLRFRNRATGHTLAVVTTGVVSGVSVGRTARGIAGWVFPQWRTSVPAPQIDIRSPGGLPITTTFTMH